MSVNVSMLRQSGFCIVLLALATAASVTIADDWSAGQLAKAREFSESLDTAAVVIVQNGDVVDQWGAIALPLKCHSVRKSLLSALYGAHVENGTIALDSSLAELGVDDNEPSLSDEERSATIGDLLKARSGVYHPALYETAAMAAKRPPRGSHPPDTFWYYNNWDFNAACTIFENLTGRSLFEEFETQVARPLELQDFRRRRDTRYVTGDDSVHPAYPFQLSARDLARFGQLMLQNGRWGDEQIVPAQWMRESTASYSDAGASGGYGYMWWVAVDGTHFPGLKLPPESYSARGHRGQYLVIIPEWNLVVCHRVNTFQKGTAVSKTQFGKLLAMILAAREERADADPEPADSGSQVTFDVLIRGGEVVDGTGRERCRADVGISSGLIAKVGDLRDASGRRTIDAQGKLVCPGFIDLHSHAEKGLVHEDPARRSAPNLITQGITTVVVNQDGGGPFDLDDQRKRMATSRRRLERDPGAGPWNDPAGGHGRRFPTAGVAGGDRGDAAVAAIRTPGGCVRHVGRARIRSGPLEHIAGNGSSLASRRRL
jgi:CubicO group peptidase (beta-lactamase class C family)